MNTKSPVPVGAGDLVLFACNQNQLSLIVKLWYKPFLMPMVLVIRLPQEHVCAAEKLRTRFQPDQQWCKPVG